MTNNIAQLVDRKRSTYCICGRERLGQIVEAMRHSRIFHEVTFMQNIRASYRHLNFHHIWIRGRRLGAMSHAPQQTCDFLRILIQTCTAIHIRDTHRGFTRIKVWRDDLCSIRVYDTNRLNNEWLCTVFREHRNQVGNHNVQLRLVQSSHINKHILRVELNLGMVRINNGRHGQNTLLLVENNRINRTVTNDVQVAA